MKEVSLVVTHGGHGTVTRSLVNGVPLLVIPMGRDQGDNAARVVARGAGLSLADGVTEPEIVSAVGRLITEAHFRAAARSLGEAMARDLTSPILVTEMEEIATRRWHRSA
jgi:UDP:flavonoid glycosyltransferase YjiC (YdhE family)